MFLYPIHIKFGLLCSAILALQKEKTEIKQNEIKQKFKKLLDDFDHYIEGFKTSSENPFLICSKIKDGSLDIEQIGDAVNQLLRNKIKTTESVRKMLERYQRKVTANNTNEEHKLFILRNIEIAYMNVNEHLKYLITEQIPKDFFNLANNIQNGTLPVHDLEKQCQIMIEADINKDLIYNLLIRYKKLNMVKKRKSSIELQKISDTVKNISKSLDLKNKTYKTTSPSFDKIKSFELDMSDLISTVEELKDKINSSSINKAVRLYIDYKYKEFIAKKDNKSLSDLFIIANKLKNKRDIANKKIEESHFLDFEIYEDLDFPEDLLECPFVISSDEEDFEYETVEMEKLINSILETI